MWPRSSIRYDNLRLEIDAYSGGVMRPSGSQGDVIVNLEGVSIPGIEATVPILMHHRHDEIVGHAHVTIDAAEIHARGVVSGGGEAATEFLNAARNGFPWKISVGLSVERAEFVKDKQTAQVNGKSISGSLTVVQRSMLGEISVLPWPADSSTAVWVAAKANQSQGGDSMSDETEDEGFN